MIETKPLLLDRSFKILEFLLFLSFYHNLEPFHDIKHAGGKIIGEAKGTERIRVTLFIFSRVHATLHPALSVRPSVRWSVRPSVGPSVRPSVTLYFFLVFAVYGLTAPAQMIW